MFLVRLHQALIHKTVSNCCSAPSTKAYLRMELTWVQLGLLLIIWSCWISYIHNLSLSLLPHTTFPWSLRCLSGCTAAEHRGQEYNWLQADSVSICWALPWSTLHSFYILGVANAASKKQWTLVLIRVLLHSDVEEDCVLNTEEKFV